PLVETRAPGEERYIVPGRAEGWRQRIERDAAGDRSRERQEGRQEIGTLEMLPDTKVARSADGERRVRQLCRWTCIALIADRHRGGKLARVGRILGDLRLCRIDLQLAFALAGPPEGPDRPSGRDVDGPVPGQLLLHEIAAEQRGVVRPESKRNRGVGLDRRKVGRRGAPDRAL